MQLSTNKSYDATCFEEKATNIFSCQTKPKRVLDNAQIRPVDLLSVLAQLSA